MNPTSNPIQIQELLIFGASNRSQALWAYHQIQDLKPFYPNGFKQITLNYKRKQLTVKPAQ